MCFDIPMYILVTSQSFETLPPSLDQAGHSQNKLMSQSLESSVGWHMLFQNEKTRKKNLGIGSVNSYERFIHTNFLISSENFALQIQH